MDIQTRQAGKATVVSPTGKVDAMTAPALEATISAMIDEGKLSLVFDFGGVDYISSAGLRVVLATAKLLKGKGGTLLLANVRGPVKEIFDISGFGAIFSMYDSVDAAVSTAG